MPTTCPVRDRVRVGFLSLPTIHERHPLFFAGGVTVVPSAFMPWRLYYKSYVKGYRRVFRVYLSTKKRNHCEAGGRELEGRFGVKHPRVIDAAGLS